MTDRLPIDEVKGALLDALDAHRRALVIAPPGAGKTTRIPLFIDEARICTGDILLLEPRRIAARAAARRMAEQRRERVGESIGLIVRHERQVSARTRIRVMTEGVLTRRLVEDATLDGVGCVLLDEVHERNAHTDLALAMLRELTEVRDDLLLVLMSATIEPGLFAAFLGDCPVVRSEGRAYPLEVEFAPKPDDRHVSDRVAGRVRTALARTEGDVLAFLPGTGEIRRCAERLGDEGPKGVEVRALHGSLSARDQDDVMKPRAGGPRRVVLATNLAESSVTVPGVRVVVDGGLEKRVEWSPTTGAEALVTRKISQDAADQRAGRAGRLGPGVAFRCWTEREHAQLAAARGFELGRVDLSGPLLAVLSFAPGDPSGFGWLEAPPPAHLSVAVRALVDLGLVDARTYALTARGRALSTLPLAPRTAVLLEAAAARGALEHGALAAALLDERDVLSRGVDVAGRGSDLMERIDRMEAALGSGASGYRREGLEPGAALRVEKAAKQLQAAARRLPSGPSSLAPGRALSQALVASWPDRVCAARPEGTGAVRARGGGVALAESSAAHGAPLFVALDVGGARGGASAKVWQAHAIEREDLEAAAPHLIRVEEAAELDASTGRIRGLRRTRFLDLVLELKEGVPLAPGAVEEALARAATERFDEVFRPDDDTRRLIARVQAAARAYPDEGWPDVGREALRQHIPSLCAGKRTLDEVARADWSGQVRAMLGPLAWALDQKLPERVEVPSGSKVRLDYAGAAEGQPVVLAVRIQELFGLRETPRIAEGRIPVLWHLLAPNGRPAQVTEDIDGFWDRTYPEVRKELRRRYPKHAWPDDPRTAAPERRPRRRRR